MLLESHEALLDKLSEQFIVLALEAAEYVDIFLGQLEGRLLELEALARGIGEQEAVVDVNDVAFSVDHYVLVVPVLNLKDVLHQRVAGQAVAEVLLSSLEPLALDLAFAVLHHEVVEEGHSISSLVDFVDAHGVVDHFDEPAVGTSSQDLVGLEPDLKFLHFENLRHLGDQLHGELLLADVVARLYDNPDQVPGFELAEGRVLLDSNLLGLGRLSLEALQIDNFGSALRVLLGMVVAEVVLQQGPLLVALLNLSSRCFFHGRMACRFDDDR
mmetsp:Transcript_36913/g.56522  ORF Transcript_36913/g.56522 Transcript_36913/m.56522 type:complete len:271 (+) Transcript_36913:265-1077(+)